MYKKLSAIIAVILISLSLLNVSAEKAAVLTLDGPKTIAAGEEIEIEVNLNGNELVSATGRIDFDTKQLQFVSASGNLARWSLETNTIDGTVFFATANVTAREVISKKTAVFTVTFKANENLGNQTVHITAVETKASSGNSALSVADAKYSVIGGTVKTNNESADTADDRESNDNITIDGPSNNNRLKSLTVKGVKLSPEFDPEEKKYEAEVPFEIEELEVEAVPADEKATVTVSDTELKYIGKNITRVQVISESGLKRTYKIYTTRNAQSKKSTDSQNNSSGLAWWIIVLIVLAVLTVAAAIVILILRRKKKS